jgi:hypothetical protein
MTIQEMNFIFDNEPSEFYDVMLCTFDSSNSSSNDEETEIVTVKTNGNDRFRLADVKYSNPLKFTLTIAKVDGSFIDSHEQRRIKKWLCKRNRYCYFLICQDDMDLIQYRCIMTFNSMVDVGRRNAGMSFDVICDAPYAWSSNIYYKVISTSTNTLKIYSDSDFDDVMLPTTTKITVNGTGNIKITNTSTNEYVEITDCTVGEIITLDGDNEIIESSTNRLILDKWNMEFLELQDGNNNLTIEGNCKVEITYRYPRRVGG